MQRLTNAFFGNHVAIGFISLLAAATRSGENQVTPMGAGNLARLVNHNEIIIPHNAPPYQIGGGASQGRSPEGGEITSKRFFVDPCAASRRRDKPQGCKPGKKRKFFRGRRSINATRRVAAA